MTTLFTSPKTAPEETRQDSRHYGWVFFALSLSNGILGYLDARDQLTSDWDNLTFPIIMTLYFIASVTVTIRPQWIEPTFVMTLFPTTIYQVGIMYLAIHHPDHVTYYSAASGTSFFPFVYVGLFIVSAKRGTLYSTLHCSAFFALAIFNQITLESASNPSLQTQAEHLLNAMLLSHPIYILALRYIVRLRERLHLANKAAHEDKTAFLSMLSHEIRNLLQTMVIAIDQLDLRLKSPTDRKVLGRLQTSAEHLHTYLLDVGELTKLENPTLKLEFETFILSELLDETRDEWLSRAHKNGLELTLAEFPPSQVTRTICSDRNRLRQILTNLLSNAVKYTSNGQISVTAKYGEKELRIEVSDTGIGIPTDQHERIFQPHVRLSNAIVQVTDGSGLGLAIVAKLVQGLNGRIELESEPGRGSTFTVVLPIFGEK